MNKLHLPTLGLFLILAAAAGSSAFGAIPSTRHLLFQNAFSSPEEVVRYFVDRDSAGFVWSGLDAPEIREFTNWTTHPSSESYLIATHFTIAPVRYEGKGDSKAIIDVDYHIEGMVSGMGGMTPSGNGGGYRRSFQLSKIDGKWKIIAPTAGEIVPIILKDHLPKL